MATEQKTVEQENTESTEVETVVEEAETEEASTEKDEAETEEAKSEEKIEEKSKEVEVKYDLKLPENSLLPPSRIDEISTFAKENGLSNEVAQKIINRESETTSFAMNAAYVKLETDTKQIAKDMLAQAEKDSEIGGKDGSDFKANMTLVKRTLEATTSPAFKEVLNKFKDDEGRKLGDHPETIRHFLRLSGLLKVEDDKFERGASPSGKTKKSTAEILYGKQN